MTNRTNKTNRTNSAGFLEPSQIQAYLKKLKKEGASPATLKRKEAALKKFQSWQGKEHGSKYPLPKGVPKSKKIISKGISPKIFPPFLRYFSFLIGLVLLASLGWGVYSQFFAQPKETPSMALPTNPPLLISFQGQLTDEVSTPINATVSATFRLYNVDEGGTALWEEQKNITTDTDGIFNTFLGDTTTLDPAIFRDNMNLWLAIEIDNDGEMEPRQQIATVGYAFNSQYLQGYEATTTATANTIPVINADGDLILASSSPAIEATSGTFGLKGEAITIQSTGGTGGGDILIQPDADTKGQVIIYSATTADNSFTVQNSNITTGSLIYGEAGTSASGYNLLKLASGSTLTDKFVVDYAGNTDITGNLTVDSSGFFAGNVGIGTTSPTARLQLAGGTTTLAPLKLTSGTNLTTAQTGALEYDGAELYFTPTGTTRETVAYISDVTAASHEALTIGNIGSSPNAKGMTLTGQLLNLEPASADYGGVITTGAQTLAGDKTLNGLLTTTGINNNTIAITNSAAYTQSGTSANTFTGTSTFSNATYSALFTGGNVGIGTTSPRSILDVRGQLTGGIGAMSTYAAPGGALDWNDKTNSASGTGYTLLFADATNGPIPSVHQYYHSLNFEYGSKTGETSTSVTQLAIPYSPSAAISQGIYMRGRYSDSWTSWVKILSENLSGNVGIGTTGPSQKLHVAGNAYVSGNVDVDGTLYFDAANADGNIDMDGFDIIDGNALYFDYLYDRDRGDEAIELTDEFLRINDNNNFANGIWIGASNFKASNGDFLIGTTGGNTASIRLYSDSTNTNFITINGTSNGNSWFNTGGNVGIGTTNPGQKLHVAGNLRVDGAIVAPEGTLRDDGGGWVRTYGATGWYSQTHGGGWYMTNSTYVKTYNNKPIYVSAGNSYFGGNVGIGTTAPSSHLEINKDANPTTFKITANNDNYWKTDVYTNSIGSYDYVNTLINQGDWNILHSARIRFKDSSDTSRFDFYSTGNMYAHNLTSSSTAGVALHINNSTREIFKYTSSLRYKHSVNDLEIDTSKLYDLRPVSFTPNGSSERTFGLIAEEVYQVLPELVIVNEQGQPDAVLYSNIGVLLLNEMKKQKPVIDQLSSLLKENNSTLSSAGDLQITRIGTNENTNQDESIESQIANLKSQNYSLKLKTGETVERIANFAETTTARLKAGLTETTNLIAENLVAKRITSGKIISPVVETEQLKVKSEKLKVSNQNGQSIAEFDTTSKKTTLFGNLEVAGNTTSREVSAQRANFGELLAQNVGIGQLEAEEISADTIAVSNDATISGTLYVDRIVAREGGFGELLAQNLSMEGVKSITGSNGIENQEEHRIEQDSDGKNSQGESFGLRPQDDENVQDNGIAKDEEEFDLEALLAKVEEWAGTSAQNDLPLECTNRAEDQILNQVQDDGGGAVQDDGSGAAQDDGSGAVQDDGTSHSGPDPESKNLCLVDTNFTVLGGRTSLADTAIAGQLSVGNLVINNNSLDVLGDTLYLQKLAMGGLDILNGKLTVDINGNVFIAAHLTVGGGLATNEIRPMEGGDLTFNLANVIPDPIRDQGETDPDFRQDDGEGGSQDDGNKTGDNAGFGKLLVKGINNETVASIDASGSAEFKKVSTDLLEINTTKEASQSGEVIIAAAENFENIGILAPGLQTNATAGEATLPAGEKEIIIYNDKLTDQSLVYLTPTADTKNKILYVKEKQILNQVQDDGGGAVQDDGSEVVQDEENINQDSGGKTGYFVVGLNEALNWPVKFNWWIIN